jgi:ADP-ribose pyrophosphatase YjhB (NUDIX family)
LRSWLNQTRARRNPVDRCSRPLARSSTGEVVRPNLRSAQAKWGGGDLRAQQLSGDRSAHGGEALLTATEKLLARVIALVRAGRQDRRRRRQGHREVQDGEAPRRRHHRNQPRRRAEPGPNRRGRPPGPHLRHPHPRRGQRVRHGRSRVNDASEIPLIRRTDNNNCALPGGAIDLGESVAQAAVRETLEESGIHWAITGIVGIHSDPKHVILYTGNGEARQEFSIVLTARPLSERDILHGNAVPEVQAR